jgi:hypothetical protein
VLDTAAPTEHVLFEASETFRRDSLNDIVFVSDSSGRFPVLERLYANGGARSSRQIYTVRPSDIDIAVRSLLWHKIYRGAFPRLVQSATIETLVQTSPEAPETDYLEINTIRANSGMICEFDYCERDRSIRDDDALMS